MRTLGAREAWNVIVHDAIGGRDARAVARFGNAALVAEMSEILRAFPDVQMTEHWVLLDDARVTAWVSMSGTHAGIWRGRAPTGRPVQSLWALALEVEGDRVVDFGVLSGEFNDVQEVDNDR